MSEKPYLCKVCGLPIMVEGWCPDHGPTGTGETAAEAWGEPDLDQEVTAFEAWWERQSLRTEQLRELALSAWLARSKLVGL